MNEKARPTRIAPVVETQLGHILHRDWPQLATRVTITRTVLSRDLRHAKIWLDINGADPERILKKMQENAGKMRTALAHSIHCYTTPQLKFFRDENPEYARHIDELFAKIKAEERQ